MSPCSFSDADFVLATNSFNQIEILAVYDAAHATFGKVIYKKHEKTYFYFIF